MFRAIWKFWIYSKNKSGLLKIILKTILGVFENNFKPGYLKTVFGLLNTKIIWAYLKIVLGLFVIDLGPI